MNAIHIRGFKCFVDTKFSMGKLTVLAGVNGAGKTSLLHTIGVLHQTLCETGSLNELVLNGAIVNMGRALDVLNKLNSKSEILFEIELEGQLFPFLYTTENRESFTLQQSNSAGCKLSRKIFEALHHVEYISADRQGPKDMHSLENSFAYERSVGVRGERAVSALSSKEDLEVVEGLRKPGTPFYRDRWKLIWRIYSLTLSWSFPLFPERISQRSALLTTMRLDLSDHRILVLV